MNGGQSLFVCIYSAIKPEIGSRYFQTDFIKMFSSFFFFFFSDSISKKEEINYKESLSIDKSIAQENQQLVSPDDVLKPFAVPVLDSFLF